MRIPNDLIQKIKNSVDIVDVIGQYIALEKSGKYYKGICPFHNDSNPSLMVSQQKQNYTCYVCHNSGDVFTFLEKYLNIKWIDAVKKVAEMGNIDISKYDNQKYSKQMAPSLKPLYDITKEANRYYQYILKSVNPGAAEARKYLMEERGFTPEMIQEFGIGYAPDNKNLFEMFQNEGYSDMDIIRSGIIIESEKTGQHYDRFAGRITFPLSDASGRPVGFSGRIFTDAQKASGKPKYLNSPESDIFIKGKTLYHYKEAAEDIRHAGKAYINEGFMDVIAMSKADHNNCVAIMGTALTDEHVEMLKRVTDKVVVALDGDEAGKHSAIRTAEILQKGGLDVKAVIFPEGKDPDEMLKTYGKEGLDKCLANEITIPDLKLSYAKDHADLASYGGKRQLLNEGAKIIRSVSDRLDREHYTNELAEMTGFKVEDVREAVNNDPEKIMMTADGIEKAEKTLIACMLHDKTVPHPEMTNEGCKNLSQLIQYFYRTNDTMDVNVLSEKAGKLKPLIDEASKIKTAGVDGHALADKIGEIANKVKAETLIRKFNFTLDPKEKAQIMKEFMDMKGFEKQKTNAKEVREY